MFIKDLKSLFIKFIHSLYKEDSASDQECMNVYLNLVSLRHDIIHAYLCNALGTDLHLGTTKKFLDYFKPEQIVGQTDLSPDIVHVDDNKVLVIDVSVSKDPIIQKDKKLTKYENLKNFISDTFEVELFIFAVRPDYRDIELRLSELSQLHPLVHEFNTSECLFVLETNDTVRSQIRDRLCDTDLFTKTLEIEFGDRTHYTPTETPLEEKCDLIKQLNKDFHKVIPDITISELAKDIKVIVENEHDVQEKYADIKITQSQFISSFKELDDLNQTYKTRDVKPSLHIYFPRNKVSLRTTQSIHLSKEQQQVFDITQMFCSDTIKEANPFLYELSHEISNCLLEDLPKEKDFFNSKMFSTGSYFDEEYEHFVREKYHKYRADCAEGHTAALPFLKYCMNFHGLQMDDEKTHFFKQKIVKLPLNILSFHAKEFLNKAHNSVASKGDIRLPEDHINDTSTISMKSYKTVDAFLKVLSTDTSFDEIIPMDSVIKTKPGIDSNNVAAFKHLMYDKYMQVVERVETTYCHTFAQRYSRIAEQLLHFSGFSLPNNTFSVFNADIPNTVFLVSNSRHNTGKDVGKAFLSFGVIKKNELISELFGTVTRITGPAHSDFDYFFTNWRRLTMDKLQFIREAYFQTLSTGVTSMLRMPEEYSDNDYRLAITHNYSLRIIMAFSTKQRVAEMLADFRYMIMHSISEFGSVREFILDKMSPPYTTVLETWIVTRINRLIKIKGLFDSKKIVSLRQPTFYLYKRSSESLGGDFKIPSPWCNYTLKDIQDFLDALFLYVHTPKEPSSIHYENVKSVKTILKFQDMYDKMTQDEKEGNWSNLKDFLLTTPLTGHFNAITKLASKNLCKSYKNDKMLPQIMRNVNESISNITSTKSVIPEYEREFEKQKKLKRKQKNKIEKIKKTFEIKSSDDINIRDPSIVRFGKNVNIIKMNTSRIKVHDAVLDMLIREPLIYRTVDLALWNITNNNSKVLSDICIKAQYGAKREFYVINLGAKAMVRVFENVFKVVSQFTKSEMISVPGDKKMNVMQDITSTVVKHKKRGQEIFFVNGDCTKWSAAETMECFRSFMYGFKDLFPECLFEFLIHVLKSWQGKRIQIPASILNSTLFTSKESGTTYLENEKIAIESTQNFLQGMFNYYSSLKAVAASELTFDVWKAMYPDSNLVYRHMEHSDDYCLIVCCDNIETFRKFRLVHKIIQKSCGMNDSVKKTNVQKFLMEFISLVSFNGQLTYPHIKKIKETGMNTACSGFRDDVDMACSRIGECVRVGCTMESSYFMGRVHFANIVRAYSINKRYDTYTMFNTPVELFGIPDLHPMLYFISKGNPNNFRLCNNNYTEDYEQPFKDNAELVKKLFLLEIYNKSCEDTEVNHTEARFYFPKFRYDQEGNLIKAVREWSGSSFMESKEFFEENVEYNLVKPIHRYNLLNWLRAMYFKKNFAIAYSRTSRVQLHLRLSRFSSSDVLMPFWVNYYDEKGLLIRDSKFYNIDSYLSEIKCKLKDIIVDEQVLINNFFDKSLRCGDNTCEVFYDTLRVCSIEMGHEHKLANTVDESPMRRVWLSVENSIPTLIQYIFSAKNFMLDNRPYKSIASLERDKAKLFHLYPNAINKNPVLIRNIYNDLMTNDISSLTCMTYGRSNRRIEDYIKNQLEYGTTYKFKYNIRLRTTYSVTNPLTGELITRQLLDSRKDLTNTILDLCSLLYVLFLVKSEYKPVRFTTIIKNLMLYDEHGVSLKQTIGDFLEDLTYPTVKSFGMPLRTVKQFCFFKSVFFEDFLPLKDFVAEHTTYKYKYLICDVETQKEKVYFEYQNASYFAYLDHQDNLTLITDKRSYELCAGAYVIASRLFNKISENELEFKLSTFEMRNAPSIRLDNNILANKMFDVNEGFIHPEVLQLPTLNRLSYTMVRNKTEELMFKGVIFFPSIPSMSAPNKRNLLILPEIDLNSMSVTFNRLKLYTLPILGARQRVCVKYEEEEAITIAGLHLNVFLTQRRLEHYLLNSEKFYAYEFKDINVDEKTAYDLICKKTKEFFNMFSPYDYCGYSSEDSDRENTNDDFLLKFNKSLDFDLNNQYIPKEDVDELKRKIKAIEMFELKTGTYGLFLKNKLKELEKGGESSEEDISFEMPSLAQIKESIENTKTKKEEKQKVEKPSLLEETMKSLENIPEIIETKDEQIKEEKPFDFSALSSSMFGPSGFKSEGLSTMIGTKLDFSDEEDVKEEKKEEEKPFDFSALSSSMFGESGLNSQGLASMLGDTLNISEEDKSEEEFDFKKLSQSMFGQGGPSLPTFNTQDTESETSDLEKEFQSLNLPTLASFKNLESSKELLKEQDVESETSDVEKEFQSLNLPTLASLKKSESPQKDNDQTSETNEEKTKETIERENALHENLIESTEFVHPESYEQFMSGITFEMMPDEEFEMDDEEQELIRIAGDFSLGMMSEMEPRNIEFNEPSSRFRSYSLRKIDELPDPVLLLAENTARHFISVYHFTIRDFIIALSITTRCFERNKVKDNFALLVLMCILEEARPRLHEIETQITKSFVLIQNKGKFRIFAKGFTRSPRILRNKLEVIRLLSLNERNGGYDFIYPISFAQEKDLVKWLRERNEEQLYGEGVIGVIKQMLDLKPKYFEPEEEDDELRIMSKNY